MNQFNYRIMDSKYIFLLKATCTKTEVSIRSSFLEIIVLNKDISSVRWYWRSYNLIIPLVVGRRKEMDMAKLYGSCVFSASVVISTTVFDM